MIDHAANAMKSGLPEREASVGQITQTFADVHGRHYIGGLYVNQFLYEAFQKAWAICDADGLKNTPEIVELRAALLKAEFPK